MGSKSLSFGFGVSLSWDAGVEVTELEGLFEEVSNMKFTGISCFRLLHREL